MLFCWFDAVFRRLRNSVQNLTPQLCFVPRASYHFKAKKCKILRAFDLFESLVIEQFFFKNINCLIGLINSDNSDLKDNFVNN